jgi:hypothetical protein
LQAEVPWNPALFRMHLGPYQELSLARADLDPQIFKLFHFPLPNRTFRVNMVDRLALVSVSVQDRWGHSTQS